MRKIIPYIMRLSVLLMALSIIGQQVNATKGDVERALELLKQARAAIGGESTIGSVQSLSINGKSSRQIQLPDSAEKQINGEFEMNLMLPDRLIRIEKLTMGSPDGKAGANVVEDKEVQLKDVRVKVMHAGEGSREEKAVRHNEHAEIARYMLGVLLTPPPSFAASYNYAGEGEVEGARADIILAQGADGFAMKLYLDKSSHLPLMMSYQGSLPRIPTVRFNKGDGLVGAEDGNEVVIIRRNKNGEAVHESPEIFFERKLDDGEVPAGGRKVIMPAHTAENVEIQVRFSDFRNVGGLLLPHTFTHLANGRVESVWTVGRYEINSPTINEKFSNGIHWRAKQN